MFPKVDPIPLPAPVELFKLLEVVTVTLHFLAVQVLIGGLLVCTIWSRWGRWKNNEVLADASGAVAGRLPIVMTYVINLGIPPLLFAQVLYGRALYTSSVLMGVYWISVIPLLAVVYTLLYVMTGRSARSWAWRWSSRVALVVALKIAFVYSSNMTLMIRPQAWVEMYRADPHGLHLNMGDPTVLPRWLFMVAGGLSAGGVGLMFLGMKRTLSAPVRRLMRRWGARLAIAGVASQAAVGTWVVAVQPDGVRAALSRSPVYVGCLVAWALASLLLAAVGFLAQKKESPHWPLCWTAGGLLFGAVAASVVFRGGIRDVTLLAHGFDVWDRQVASNWVVVSAFLLLFVIGIGVLFWLGTVVARAQAVEEHYGAA